MHTACDVHRVILRKKRILNGSKNRQCLVRGTGAALRRGKVEARKPTIDAETDKRNCPFQHLLERLGALCRNEFRRVKVIGQCHRTQINA